MTPGLEKGIIVGPKDMGAEHDGLELEQVPKTLRIAVTVEIQQVFGTGEISKLPNVGSFPCFGR